MSPIIEKMRKDTIRLSNKQLLKLTINRVCSKKSKQVWELEGESALADYKTAKMYPEKFRKLYV